MMSMSTSKKILGAIWVLGFFLPFLLLIVMTKNDSMHDPGGAWGWFLPTMLPTISLIVAVFVSDAVNPDAHERRVSRFIFGLAIVFSLLYIGLVVGVALDIPLSTSPTKLNESLKNSNLYLGPIQGLLTGILGVFFVHQSKAQS